MPFYYAFSRITPASGQQFTCAHYEEFLCYLDTASNLFPGWVWSVYLSVHCTSTAVFMCQVVCQHLRFKSWYILSIYKIFMCTMYGFFLYLDNPSHILSYSTVVLYVGIMKVTGDFGPKLLPQNQLDIFTF